VPFTSQSFGEQSAEAGAGAGDENHLLGIHDYFSFVALPSTEFDAGRKAGGYDKGIAIIVRICDGGSLGRSARSSQATWSPPQKKVNGNTPPAKCARFIRGLSVLRYG
jgi:hypothetical protein